MNALEKLGWKYSEDEETGHPTYTYYFHSKGTNKDDKKVIHFEEGLGIGHFDLWRVHFDDRFVYDRRTLRAVYLALEEMNAPMNKSDKPDKKEVA